MPTSVYLLGSESILHTKNADWKCQDFIAAVGSHTGCALGDHQVHLAEIAQGGRLL